MAMGKSPEELYRERERRISDAIALKEPDRVPVVHKGIWQILLMVKISQDAMLSQEVTKWLMS